MQSWCLFLNSLSVFWSHSQRNVGADKCRGVSLMFLPVILQVSLLSILHCMCVCVCVCVVWDTGSIHSSAYRNPVFSTQFIENHVSFLIMCFQYIYQSHLKIMGGDKYPHNYIWDLVLYNFFSLVVAEEAGKTIYLVCILFKTYFCLSCLFCFYFIFCFLFLFLFYFTSKDLIFQARVT